MERSRESIRTRVNECERDREREKVNSIAACLCSGLGVFLKKKKKKKLRAANLHTERVSFECPISQSDFLWQSLAHSAHNREFSVSASYSDEFTNFFFSSTKIVATIYSLMCADVVVVIVIPLSLQL